MSYLTITLRSAPEIKRIVEAAFPSYRKHKATLSVFNGGVNINSYWDGGSRDEYAVVDLATCRRGALPTASHPYFDVARHGIANVETDVISVDHVGNVTLKVLPEGFALVAAGTFCGKPATAHIYLHSSSYARIAAAVSCTN